jgi:hypothetical protein
MFKNKLKITRNPSMVIASKLMTTVQQVANKYESVM